MPPSLASQLGGDKYEKGKEKESTSADLIKRKRGKTTE